MPIKTPPPLVFAHRGAPQEAPENTGAAFHKALQYPIDGIELDVQMSADGVLALFHDNTLKKLGQGQNRICDLPWQKLQSLDAGSWFDPSFAGEPLMTFEGMLEMLAGKTRLFIEIKARDVRATDDAHDRLLVDKVLAAMDTSLCQAHQQNLAVLCFNPFLLWHGHQTRSGIKWVLNFQNWPPQDILPLAGLSPEFLWAVCGDIEHLEPATVAWARQHGLQVFAYTCNHQPQIDKALQLDLDAVITDRPGWLAARFKTHP